MNNQTAEYIVYVTLVGVKKARTYTHVVDVSFDENLKLLMLTFPSGSYHVFNLKDVVEYHVNRMRPKSESYGRRDDDEDEDN